MGVVSEWHRHQIGTKLIIKCEEYGRRTEIEHITVKTLDESRESRSYEKTRLFYLARGFAPLEVFPLFWNEENPCLFMAKSIKVG